MSNPLRRRINVPANAISAATKATAVPDAASASDTISIEAPQPKSAQRTTLRTILIIVTHLFTATVFLAFMEGWTLLDALYVSVVIATTVGYGDITPIRPISKLFISVYAVLSVVLIATLLQSLVQKITELRADLAEKAASRLIAAGQHDNPAEIENELVTSSREAVTHARSKFISTLVAFGIVCFSGAALYGKFLQVPYIDLLYFLCVTMTTVGLGDIHPISSVGKAYAVIWLLLASLGFANIVAQYTEMKVKQQERDVIEKMMSVEISAKMFAEIDIDKNGVLTESEYLGYVLCQMGKATPGDVSIAVDFPPLPHTEKFVSDDQVPNLCSMFVRYFR